MIFRPITCIEDKFAKIENSVCNLYSREIKTTLNSEKAWDGIAGYWHGTGFLFKLFARSILINKQEKIKI